jgi:hypothetical protein
MDPLIEAMRSGQRKARGDDESELQIDSVVIPPTVVNIGSIPPVSNGVGVFAGRGIKKVIIPNSVKYIGYYAFANNKLTEVVLPDSVTALGTCCFANNLITKITLSKNLKEIPNGAFKDNLLVELEIPEGITGIGGAGPYNGNATMTYAGAFMSNKLVYVKLPKSLKTLDLDVSGTYLIDEFVYRGGTFIGNNAIAFIDVSTDILYARNFFAITVIGGRYV